MVYRFSYLTSSKFIGIVVVIVFGYFAFTTQAAPLNYSNDTVVTLTSPATTLTILANSVADSVVVEAGDVKVTMSASTGGLFYLRSTSVNLSVSTSGSGGTASVSCNQSVAQANISQSTGSATYTISPSGSSKCVDAPAIGVASGGGGGGGTVFQPPAVTTPTSSVSSSVPSPTIADLQAKLAALQTTWQSLLLQQTQKAGTAVSGGKFSKNLKLGSSSSDVKNLQLFLIGRKVGSAAQALAKVGATGHFGSMTRLALVEYQKAVGISPASGYFGPKTRNYINSFSQ